jgi:hypothetical protein
MIARRSFGGRSPMLKKRGRPELLEMRRKLLQGLSP